MSLTDPTNLPPPLPPPGERVELPEGGEFLWVNVDERGRTVVDEIALDPTPFQLGDYVLLRGKPGQRRVRALVRAAPIYTFWFEFPPEVSEEDRESAVQRLAPVVMRHNQDESRLALVVPRWAKKRTRSFLQPLVEKGLMRPRPEPKQLAPMTLKSQLAVSACLVSTGLTLYGVVGLLLGRALWPEWFVGSIICWITFMHAWLSAPLIRSGLGVVLLRTLGLLAIGGSCLGYLLAIDAFIILLAS